MKRIEEFKETGRGYVDYKKAEQLNWKMERKADINQVKSENSTPQTTQLVS